MFIPLKMVLIGIDPYPYATSQPPPHWDPRSRLTWVDVPAIGASNFTAAWVHPAVPPPCRDLHQSHVLRSKNTLAVVHPKIQSCKLLWESLGCLYLFTFALLLEFAMLICSNFMSSQQRSAFKCSNFSSLILFQYWQLGSLHNGSCPRCCTAAGSRALSVTKKGVSVRSPWTRPQHPTKFQQWKPKRVGETTVLVSSFHHQNQCQDKAPKYTWSISLVDDPRIAVDDRV